MDQILRLPALAGKSARYERALSNYKWLQIVFVLTMYNPCMKTREADLKKHLDLVVNVLGDETLSANEIITRVLETLQDLVHHGTIRKWISQALAQKLIDRVRAKENPGSARRGPTHLYFVAGCEPVQSIGDPFIIQTFCSSCGHDRRIEFMGNTDALNLLHRDMTWGCHGCGDLIHLADMITMRDLSREFSTWVVASMPHKDRKRDDRRDPPFASIGSC